MHSVRFATVSNCVARERQNASPVDAGTQKPQRLIWLCARVCESRMCVWSGRSLLAPALVNTVVLRRSRKIFEVGRKRRAFPFDLSIGEANSKQRFERASRIRSNVHRRWHRQHERTTRHRDRYAANTRANARARKPGMRGMLGTYRVTWFVCRLVWNVDGIRKCVRNVLRSSPCSRYERCGERAHEIAVCRRTIPH